MKKIVGLVLVVVLLLSASILTYAEDEQMIIKPLVILMDYQDYTHDQMADLEEKSHQTGDAYVSYEKDLYETLFFGEGTYTGPNGESYITFREYFNQLSNGYYVTDGDVFGWYQASMNAAEYGGDQNDNGSDQDEAKLLVQEALDFVALEEGIDLSIYDRLDPNDLDNDGNTNEPDGEIDVVIIIHAGRGEEWGGGTLEADAIWPFRIGFDWYADGEKYEVSYGENTILSNDFLVFEQDFPMGLASHEFSHYLNLPDLYNYNGTSPVQEWSNMGGSYSGSIPGALPPNLGGYGRYLLAEQELNEAVELETLTLDGLTEGLELTLSASADVEGDNTNLVKIELPQKETIIVTPTSGSNVYYSETGNYLTQEMTTSLDLTAGTAASLSFKTWYDIDPEWDYASVQVKTTDGEWMAIEGNITTTENPNDDTPDVSTDRNPGHGITNDTAGEWVDATFDLTTYVGQVIDLRFFFWTDSNTPEIGIYLDDIQVTLDETVILSDDAESDSTFTFNGFVKDSGKTIADHYYLLEYRDHQGVDVALTHTYYRHPESSFNQGLLVWYIDETYNEDGEINQDQSAHPGHISVGVVDAGQDPTIWRTEKTDEYNVDYVSYQLHDAAFSLISEPLYRLDWGTVETIDESRTMQPIFSDGFDYSSPETPEGGLVLVDYNLEFYVLEENIENRTMTIQLITNSQTQEPATTVLSIVYGDKDVKVELTEDFGNSITAVAYGEIRTLDQTLITLTKRNDVYVGALDNDFKLGTIIIDNAGAKEAIYNSQLFEYGINFDDLPFDVDSETYIIKSGDTLAKIAAMFDTNLGLLKKLNNIKNPHSIYAGLELLVPNN